jgi:FkbM family methyltransferase
MTSFWLRAYRRLRVDRWSRTSIGERAFLGAFFAYKKWLEDPHAAFVRRHPEVLAGGHVLDVGANVGYTATVFARAVSPGFRVFAFEPEPLNFSRLERVIARRGLRNIVTPVRTAIGDVDGTAALWRNPEHPGDHRISTDGDLVVPIARLDTFAEMLAPVKFVKIDVQGHEFAVSRGMTRLIQRDPGLEVSFEYTGSEVLSQFYAKRGFGLYVFGRDGALMPFSKANDMVRARGYCDVFATRRKTPR